jgi:hypothetical protein
MTQTDRQYLLIALSLYELRVKNTYTQRAVEMFGLIVEQLRNAQLLVAQKHETACGKHL